MTVRICGCQHPTKGDPWGCQLEPGHKGLHCLGGGFYWSDYWADDLSHQVESNRLAFEAIEMWAREARVSRKPTEMREVLSYIVDMAEKQRRAKTYQQAVDEKAQRDAADLARRQAQPTRIFQVPNVPNHCKE